MLFSTGERAMKTSRSYTAPLILTLLLVLGVPFSLFAQQIERVLWDSVATGSAVGDSVVTWDHTIGGGANRLLVVAAGAESWIAGGLAVESVTYNGAPLTKAIAQPVGSGPSDNLELWYMLEANLPAAGTYEVRVEFVDTTSLGLGGGSMSFTYAKQTAPEATSSKQAEGSLSLIRTTITTATDSALIIDAVMHGDFGTFSPGTGQTERLDFTVNGATGFQLAASTKGTALSGPDSTAWLPETVVSRLTHVLMAVAPFSVTPTPVITLTGTLVPFLSFPGTPSSQQSYTVSGTNLSADVVVTAPTDFEVSTTSGSGFGPSVTLTQSGGTLAPTTVYVRMNAASVGAPSGDITHTSAGAATKNQPVSGTVSAERVSIESIATGSAVSDSVVTWNHTIGNGSNRLLVVAAGSESNAPAGLPVASVRYNGVALTKAVVQAVGSGPSDNVELWYMLEANLPEAGTYQVRVAFTDTTSFGIGGGSMSFVNAKQSAPEATTAKSALNAPSIRSYVTTLTDSTLLIDAVIHGDFGTFSPGSGQFERINLNVNGGTGFQLASSTKGTGLTGPDSIAQVPEVTVSRIAHIVMAVAPASVTPTPVINVIGTLAPFSGFPGEPSAEQSYTVSGANLSANVVVTAPTDFEVSTTSGSGFGPSVILTQTGGTLAPTLVYVRMNASTVGTPSGDITHSSTGAGSKNLPVSGTVSADLVRLEAVATGSGVGDSVVTWDHTIGSGLNRLLVVAAGSEDWVSGGLSVASVTYDGVPLTRAIAQGVGAGPSDNVELWYMLDANLPSAGTYQIRVAFVDTAAFGLGGGSMSFTNANQSAPEASTSKQAEGSIVSIKTNITTVTDSALLVDAVIHGDFGTFSPGTDQTERFDITVNGSTGFELAASTKSTALAGPDSVAWVPQAAVSRIAHVVIAVAPPSVTPTPVITVTGALAPFSAYPGIASAEQSYTVAGSNLTADIVVTAPTDFEVSTTSGSGFGPSVTLTQAGGTVAPTPVYARMNSATVGTPSGNITHASTGAATKNQPVSGVVSLERVILDAVATGTANADSVVSWSHTIGGGANRILVVAAASEGFVGGGLPVSSITYNGTALTRAVGEPIGTGPSDNVELWYLLDAGLPSAGTYTVRVAFADTTSLGLGGGSLSFTNARQGPPDATAKKSALNVSSVRTTITTATDSSILLDAVVHGSFGTFSPGTGQFERFELNAGGVNGLELAASTKGTILAGPDSMGQVPVVTVDRLAHIIMAIAPAGTTPSPLITVTGSLAPFTSFPGTPSAPQNYSVSGTSMTDDIVITAPTDFEVSTSESSGFGTSVTLTPAGGAVAATAVYARMNSATVGMPSGTISHTSTGATTQNLPVSGTVSPERVVLDATSTGTGADGDSVVTWNHTVGSGANRLLVVAAAAEDWPGTPLAVQSVTYNGVALTRAISRQIPDFSIGTDIAELWYMLDAQLPSAGTYQVRISLADTTTLGLAGGALSFTNAKQAAPEDTASNALLNASTIQTSITALTDSTLVIDAVVNGGFGEFTPGGGQFEHFDLTAGGSLGFQFASSTKGTGLAGPDTMRQTVPGPVNRLVQVVMAVAPASVTLTPPEAPLAKAATNVTSTSFEANWATVSRATSYRLDVATDNQFTSYVSGYNNKSVTDTTDLVTGVTPTSVNYFYRVRAVNDGGSSPNSDTVAVTAGVTAALRIFMKGPYSAGVMSTALRTAGLIPLAHPYSGAPWNYAGTEAVGSIPANVVDWVLVQLRSDTSTVVAERAAFILSDGTIVDTAGTGALRFAGLGGGDYYVVVYHRNHLAVMSASALTLSSTTPPYDFSTAATQSYGTGGVVDMGGGVWGMWGGDANSSGTVTFTGASNDRNSILLIVGLSDLTNIVSNVYEKADLNLSGSVTFTGAANDRNAILATVGLANLTNIVSTRVPAPGSSPAPPAAVISGGRTGAGAKELKSTNQRETN
jgi:hypothetical protein